MKRLQIREIVQKYEYEYEFPKYGKGLSRN